MSQGLHQQPIIVSDPQPIRPSNPPLPQTPGARIWYIAPLMYLS